MWKALLQSMRLRQWTKNAFVLAAVVFDRQLSFSDQMPLLRSLTGAFLFCLISSVVYIVNDIADAEADRAHPTKKQRPIASGRLPVTAAMAFSALLFIVTLVSSYLLSPGFALIILLYFGLNLLYSKWLKHIPLVDVLLIAAFFVLRVGAGAVIIQVQRFSPWLYVVTTLFALYIGFGKRRAELSLLADDAQAHRKVLNGYNLPFLDQLITVVSSCTILAYSLYTFSAPNLPANHAMMLTVPFVMYGIFRYLYLIQIERKGGAPEELLLEDRPLQLTIGLWVISILFIFYVF